MSPAFCLWSISAAGERSLAGYVMSVSGRKSCILGRAGKVSRNRFCRCCKTEYEYQELVRRLGEDEERVVIGQVRKLLMKGKIRYVSTLELGITRKS